MNRLVCMHLNQVIPPHDVIDAAKFAALVNAYDADETVKPFVVVDFGAACVAISGSHRIAAAQSLFEDDTDIEECGLGLVVDGENLAAFVAGDDVAADALADLRADKVSRYGDVIDALWQYLPADVQAALEDQRTN